MRDAGSRQLHVALGLTFAVFMAACSGGGGSSNPPPPAPAIQLSTTTLSFSATVGGTNPASQSVTVSNSGGGTLAAPTTAVVYGSGSNWLTANVSGSGTPYAVTVQPSISSMAAGTYTATLSISSAGASNSPQTVAVTLTLVDPQPSIALSSSTISFSGVAGAASPAPQTITISNGGGGTLAAPDGVITFPDATDWLDGVISGAAAPYTLTLTPNAAGLAVGTYTATVTITSAGASNSPRTVNVSMTLASPPSIALSATTIAFSGTVGATSPAAQTITISNGGGGTLAVPDGVVEFPDANFWLEAVLTGAASPFTLTLTPDATGLAAGTYTATITITSANASNSPRTVNVSMTLVDPPPMLTASVTSVAFTSRSYPGVDPAAQSLTITNGGGGTLAPPSAVLEFPNAIDWLDGVVTGTVAPYTITLQPTVAALGLGAGTYTATLGISSTGASNTLSIPITLTLTTSWTVFVYGHADHTLSGSLLADIQEMNQAVLGDSVTVLVAADYSAARTMPDGAFFPVGTVVYDIIGSGNPPLEAATGIEQNFDDPAVLAAWTQSVFETYPADRYAIVLWDHGGSWKVGFGGDEQNVIDQQGSPMSPATVADAVWTALANAGLLLVPPLEFLAFDTCLMMGNEVAYEFADLADVYLAAAELDFGNGWDYQASLSELGANPDIGSSAFGLAEVDDWDAHHASAGLEDVLLRAHAAIDLTRIRTYAAAWQDLATTIAQSASVDWLELARTQFDTMPGYLTMAAIDVNPQPDLRDAGQLLAGLRQITSDPAVASAATNAQAALSDLFIRTSLGSARQAAGQWGMQVEAPLTAAWLGRATQYSTLDWDLTTGWSSVLDGIAANADAVSPVVQTAVQNAGAVTPIDPAVVTLWSDDQDVAFARMYLAQTIAGTVIEYGVVGESAIDPSASYLFSWAAEQPALADATYLSEVYIAPWLTAGATTLYVLPGRIGNARVFAIYEDGSTTVDTILVVSSGNAAVFALEDFGGLTFVPQVLNATDAVWLDATPLAVPDVAGASLDFGWAQVAAGTYHLGTEMTDVWGNIGNVVNDVTVN